jgi:hypothetical protein
VFKPCGGPILSDSESDQVVREILSYFIGNPQAADNLEGIVRWRLLNEAVYRKVDETRMALAWLVEKGFLTQASKVGNDLIFVLNPEKRDEAEQFLAATEP